MSGFRERDFLKRAIEQFSKAMARVLRLRREKKYDEAQQALGELYDDLVGLPRSVADRLDPASAANLLRDPDKLRIWARLVREEADLAADQGLDPAPLRDRALQLLDEAIRRSSETDEDRELRKLLS